MTTDELGLLAVEDAMTTRRSVRAFTTREVTRETVVRILNVAARAPSGHNSQPWRVHVLSGAAIKRLTAAIMEEFVQADFLEKHAAAFDSYPSRWYSPYVERRRKVGLDMYGILGIAKGDTARMQEQAGKNFDFFGAPVGLIFAVEEAFVPSSAIDMGMFLGNIMVGARARGMDTCPQAAFGICHRIVSQVLELPADQTVLCGMALGYADRDAPLNSLKTERQPAAEFATFHS